MKKPSILLALPLAASFAGTAMAEPGKWYAGIAAGQSHYENWASKTDITQFMDEFGAGIGVDDFRKLHLGSVRKRITDVDRYAKRPGFRTAVGNKRLVAIFKNMEGYRFPRIKNRL